MVAPISAPVDFSGLIGTGGVAQVLAPANANRTRLTIVNVDAVNDIWISATVTAAPNKLGSIRIPANGGMLSFNGDAPGTQISIYGAVTSQQFTAFGDG